MKHHLIRPQMPVVAADQRIVAKVEAIESIFVKAADDEGKPHWFPLDWVERVEDQLFVNRSSDELREEWSDHPPQLDA